MTSFRAIAVDEWSTVGAWWLSAGLKGFRYEDLPETSYFAILSDERMLAASLILTNSKIAWIEGFIGNPKADREKRRETTPKFLKFLTGVAAEYGARRLFCMGPTSGLTRYYEMLGFKKTASVDTLIKEIE